MLRATKCSRFFTCYYSSSDSDIEELIQRPSNPLHSNVINATRRFIDLTRVKVTSGDGGAGLHTFTRIRGTRGVFPAGGNGGAGGNILIEPKLKMKTLPSTKTYIAAHGENGRSKDCDGANGADALIRVPLGTIIREVSKLGKTHYFSSIDKATDKVLVARGGKGGRGNKKHTNLDRTEPGERGVSKVLELELKLVADVGLVGYPNAGKSTLLGAISRACPKIASYPFTTLQPYIGTINFEDGRRMTVADMPGLIEGAHQNRGLGHLFLKHIQRTKGIVYVLDASDSPAESLYVLYNELKLYDQSLVQKPFLIAINKTDLDSGEDVKGELDKIFTVKTVLVSAKYGGGLDSFVRALRDLVLLNK